MGMKIAQLVHVYLIVQCYRSPFFWFLLNRGFFHHVVGCHRNQKFKNTMHLLQTCNTVCPGRVWSWCNVALQHRGGAASRWPYWEQRVRLC